MNDINKIINAIKNMNNSATLDEICKYYASNFSTVVFSQNKSVILNTLKTNLDKVCFNNTNSHWELVKQTDKDLIFLYDSENKKFDSIRDVMTSLFGISAKKQCGYFDIDDQFAVWFPQPSNKNYKNVLSADKKYRYITPSEKNKMNIPSSKQRYTFIKDEGYRFCGVYQFKEINSFGIRVFEKVDDKVDLSPFIKNKEIEKIQDEFYNYVVSTSMNNKKNYGSVSEITAKNYKRYLRELSKYLNEKQIIHENIFIINKKEVLEDIYEKVIHGTGYLKEWNNKVHNSISSAIKKLIEMKDINNSFLEN